MLSTHHYYRSTRIVVPLIDFVTTGRVIRPPRTPRRWFRDRGNPLYHHPNQSRTTGIGTNTICYSHAKIIFPQQQQRYLSNRVLLYDARRTAFTTRTHTHASSALSSASSSSFRIFSTISTAPTTQTPRTNHTTTNNNQNQNNTQQTNHQHDAKNDIRLSKFIAVCLGISRKDVERHIKDEQVTLYGKIVTSPAMMISYPEIIKPNNRAALTYLRKAVPVLQYGSNNNYTPRTSPSNTNTNANTATTISPPNHKVRVWLVHKLAGELVTDIDPFNRPTIMNRIHKLGQYNKATKRYEHIKIVGRLDMNTEGLLIATNCGVYARQLELAKHMLHRVYRVRVHGRGLSLYQINLIQRGQVTIDNIRYPPMKVSYDGTKSRKNANAANQWLTITCTQGKNRQVRKVLEHFRCTVTRLLRISYGDYQLGSIPRGMVQEVVAHDNDENGDHGHSNNRGIIPYDQHVRRGKILVPRFTPPPRTPTSAAVVQDSTRHTHHNKSNLSSKQKTASRRPSKLDRTTTTSQRRRRTAPTTKVPAHQPVQWIRM